MKKIAEIRKETLTKVETKLNDEQQKTWKELLGAPFEIKLRAPSQLNCRSILGSNSARTSPRVMIHSHGVIQTRHTAEILARIRCDRRASTRRFPLDEPSISTFHDPDPRRSRPHENDVEQPSSVWAWWPCSPVPPPRKVKAEASAASATSACCSATRASRKS